MKIKLYLLEMKRYLALIFMIVVSCNVTHGGVERFDKGTTGIGVVAGQPLLFRYQLWENWKRAYFFDGGYNFEKFFVGGINYLFYFYDVKDFWRTRSKSNALLFYLGPGAYLGYSTDSGNPNQSLVFSARGVGGAEYVFAGRGLSLRAEVGPAINIIGRTFLSVQGGVGITYYFGGASKKVSASDVPAKKNNKTKKTDDEEDLEDLSEFE